MKEILSTSRKNCKGLLLDILNCNLLSDYSVVRVKLTSNDDDFLTNWLVPEFMRQACKHFTLTVIVEVKPNFYLFNIASKGSVSDFASSIQAIDKTLTMFYSDKHFFIE